jgi:hypothetical protein
MVGSNGLRAIGFTVEPMDFGDTQNFWAWRGHGETLAFAGHTGVQSLTPGIPHHRG